MYKHELGLKAQSKSLGLQGTLMGRAEWLYGCNRYYLQPKVDKDGKVQVKARGEQDAV